MCTSHTPGKACMHADEYFFTSLVLYIQNLYADLHIGSFIVLGQGWEGLASFPSLTCTGSGSTNRKEEPGTILPLHDVLICWPHGELNH